MNKGKSAIKKVLSSRWFIYPAILFVCLLFIAWQFSNLLIKAHREAPEAGPEKFRIEYEKVKFNTADGKELNGWYIQGTNEKAVIFCHGIGAEKSQMVNYVPFLKVLGYSMLLFDFRGHGENKEEFISIGYAEVWDLNAAVKFVQEKGNKKIGVLGISMGAATAIRAAAQNPAINAVVADCPFASLNGMIRYRAKQMGIPYWPAVPVVKKIAELRTGYDLDAVTPLEDIKSTGIPLFLIHGLEDTNIPAENSKEIYAASREPKELLLVPGAGHVEAHSTMQKEYERQVREFFRIYLQ